jgi:branched-chain amino acid transport system substrate-binding protein
VRVRWLGLAAVAATALAVAASGCGGSGVAAGTRAVGDQLAVYSSLPLQGPSAQASQQIVDGEKLALAQAGGRAGQFKVGYVSLDDSNPTSTTGLWSPGVTATDAKTAAQDTSTIAYIGELDSAATAVSLPLINAAGIPQISPASPYVGLIEGLDAGQDEPERFYPSGKRTFARLQPGDPVQARAATRVLRSLGVHKLYVIDDQDPFAMPLAQLVATETAAAGIETAGRDSLSLALGTVYKNEAEKVTDSGADAVFFSGRGTAAAASLWRQLHSADPHLQLLGSTSTADGAFASQLGAAAGTPYLLSPVLAPAQYPPAAQRVLAAYRRTFGEAANGYALYGYEAMSLVLGAYRAAGRHGNDRQAVTARLLSTRDRDSVLGRYSIRPDGETTLARYALDRVVDGRQVFVRAVDGSR